MSACRSFADELPELALGVLTGRDRARVLAHVDSCQRCADELERLARTADTVVQVAPEVEPPLGFDVRLFERMGVAHRPRLRLGRRMPRWMPVAAAAAVIALGIGLGLGLSSSTTSPSQPASALHGPASHSPEVSGALVGSGGHTVGHVVAFDGARPWMSMMLTDSSARGWVTCVVITDTGKRETVGSFETKAGWGTWNSPLHVDPYRLRSAEVVDPGGAVIATATLS
jgi:anti-sigma factor RsiW